MESGSGKRTLGVAYASSNREGAYSTAQTRVWSRRYGKYIGFSQVVTANQDFKDYSDLITTFTLSYTGMYWVMVRLNCDAQQWANAKFEDKFTAYCKDGFLMTVSGAYYFEKDRKIGVQYTSGNSDVQPGSIFSFVHLEANTNFGRCYAFMAFTAFAEISPNPFVWFGKVHTDYGSLFSNVGRKFNIKVSGSYTVAVRGSPDKGKTLRVELYKNETSLIFTYYAEKGYKSGQTAVFQFQKGDYLQLKSIPVLTNNDTMFSLALVGKAS